MENLKYLAFGIVTSYLLIYIINLISTKKTTPLFTDEEAELEEK